MNISPRSRENNNDTKITLPNKVTRLNPNAAAFVPSVLRSTYGRKSEDTGRMDKKGSSGKTVLDRSESTVSNNFDDEAHQFWHHQLPDDITPDFNVMGEELPGPHQLSLTDLSIHDVETSRFSASRFSGTFSPRQPRSPLSTGRANLSPNLRYSGSTCTEDQTSTNVTLAAKSWDQVSIGGDQHLTKGLEGHHYNGDSSSSFVNNLLGDQAVVEEAATNPLVFLASRYPGFSAERLADVYYANGCNLNLTMEMLRQLELQGDGGFGQSTEVLDSPRLGTRDFSVLSAVEAHNGLSSSNSTAGPSKSSQLIASSFNGHGKLLYGDKSQSFGAARTVPFWRETDNAVGERFSDSREEARSYARLRDACLEQVSQAYLIGNKALSRELSEKGQLYNLQMKAALQKAGETVHQQRNPFSSQLHGYRQGAQERLIDLQNLHVSEALHVLKHELGVLRNTVRSSGQLHQAMIRVGIDHNAKGTLISRRLQVAVEQFLLEEGIHYTQPRPGLLHIVIY
ncbi:polyadenylate-binding protein-interacting protein 7-like isoform X1 [Iris pallida]|uniref:Polyadenylate-binding protein-interacting protein 7-like isoform X1 n=1 Tax=Iris pallida TaxID=29817 RepID=A0AAX6ENP9_IRIPA|nr:polyadenylate-binding protein-interacting protein 7-like isoform X1 [Iris pallida]